MLVRWGCENVGSLTSTFQCDVGGVLGANVTMWLGGLAAGELRVLFWPRPARCGVAHYGCDLLLVESDEKVRGSASCL